MSKHHPMTVPGKPRTAKQGDIEAFITTGNVQPLNANGQHGEGNAEPAPVSVQQQTAEGSQVTVDIQPETRSGQPMQVPGQPSTGNAQPVAASGQPLKARRRGMVERAGGKRLAQLTIYLSPEDGMRLKRHCLEQGLVVSEECAAVLTAWIRTLPNG